MSLVRFMTKLMMALATSMIESFAFLSCLIRYLPKVHTYLPESLKSRIQNR